MLTAFLSAQTNSAAAQEDKPTTPKAHASQKIEVNGGKIVVTDENGEKREIEIPNAKSVTVTHSVQSTVVDGKESKKVKGQAVIVGPDGQRTVIELADPTIDIDVAGLPKIFGGELADQFEGELGQRFALGLASADNSLGKYFIGLHCEPVGDAIRSHLKLDENIGLIVKDVTPDSPAAKAGLEPHDILLYAGDSPVGSVEELSKMVNKAGEEKSKVSLVVLRAGAEKTFEMEPAQREDMANLRVQMLEMPEGAKWIFGGDELGVQGLKPGVIREIPLGGEMPEEIRQHLQQLREQIEQSASGLQDMSKFREEMERARVEMQKASEEMRKQMEEMSKSIQEQMKRQREGDGESNQDRANDNDLA
jgi:membrane-associated protease RseP (regulator of RpoE activity)